MDTPRELVLYTIGHSNHSLERFIELLQLHHINAVGDVRSQPYSRRYPHFNQSNLRSALAGAGIAYVFLGKELGARPDDSSVFSNGKVSYDRLAVRSEFQEGLNRVRQGIQKYRLALLCAEKDPIQCHRMILVTRHLRTPHLVIKHIFADGSVETNELAERRLYKSLGLEPTLFTDESETIEGAYAQQGERIAFSRDARNGEANEPSPAKASIPTPSD